MRVLGIDPGQVSTGLAVRDGSILLTHDVLENSDTRKFPATIGWVTRVVDAVEAMATEYNVDILAVELVRIANVWHHGKRQVLNPSSLVATAQVLGAIQTLTCARIIEVPPGKMGAGPLGGYPDGLVSQGERRRSDWRIRVGTGKLRHARAAWDQAGQALLLEAATRL